MIGRTPDDPHWPHPSPARSRRPRRAPRVNYSDALQQERFDRAESWAAHNLGIHLIISSRLWTAVDLHVRFVTHLKTLYINITLLPKGLY